MPVSATPSIVSGPVGSLVLVDGSPCVPATAADLAVGTAATGAAVGAVVGVTLDAAVPIGVAAGATVGVAVGATDGATVNGGRVGGTITVAALHVDVMNLSLIKVTSPLRASALPSTVTPLSSVMDVIARIVPTREEPDPRLAELVTCQKTLHGLPPLTKDTELVDAVTSDDVAWKIQTELGSFWPSRTMAPFTVRMAPPEL